MFMHGCDKYHSLGCIRVCNKVTPALCCKTCLIVCAEKCEHSQNNLGGTEK